MEYLQYSRKKQEKIIALKQHILEGASSVRELAEKEHLSDSYTQKLLADAGIGLMPKSWQTQNKVLKAYREGKNTAETAKALDLSKYSIIKHLRELHLNRRKGRPKGKGKTGGNPLRDARIEDGLSLGEMARLEGKDRRTPYQYMDYHGKLDSWREKRKEVKAKAKIEERERKIVISNVVSSVMASKILSTYEDKEAAKKVVEYTAVHSCTYKSYGQLYTLFSRYYEAQRKGEKCSLEELCDGTEISIMTTSRILKAVRLPAFYKYTARTAKNS